jgi:hypothetical protein
MGLLRWPFDPSVSVTERALALRPSVSAGLPFRGAGERRAEFDSVLRPRALDWKDRVLLDLIVSANHELER